MLDRSIAPEIKTISNIIMPKYDVEILQNGTKLITVNLGSQDLLNIEIIHHGGRHLEHKKGVSRATASLLKEGYDNYSSATIANKVDFLGASLATGATLDYSYIKLFTLNKYFDELLPILEGVRYRPTLTQSELDKYIENRKRRLKIDMAKNDVIAYKTFTEELFGSDHPYGYNSTEELFEKITKEDIDRNFESVFGSDNCTIILCGKISDDIKQKVIDTFGKVTKKTQQVIYQRSHSVDYTRTTKINKESQQASIKLGFPLFNKSHKDYLQLYVANTILGGYFGSRLMKTIREEKGYTYGIYSSIDTLLHDGYFAIQTDVNDEYVKETINLTYEEIEKLSTVPVSDDELKMVKNYINGNLLNLIDGPFKVGKMAKTVALNQLNMSFLEDLAMTVNSIEATSIMDIMNKYFSNQSVKEVIVTKP